MCHRTHSFCPTDSSTLTRAADEEVVLVFKYLRSPFSLLQPASRQIKSVSVVWSSQQEDCSRPQEEEDIMDIPLDDPEANRAAAKIQAGFRGHMTRKKLKPEDKAEGEEVSGAGWGWGGGWLTDAHSSGSWKNVR